MFQSVNQKRQQGDRFIPRRSELSYAYTGKSIEDDDDDLFLISRAATSFFNFAKIRYNRLNYQRMLRSVLMPLEAKVLNFCPPKPYEAIPAFGNLCQVWPVKPRRKPVLELPCHVLDMPQISNSSINHYHIADWSRKNCLATIFENEVHMSFWRPDGCENTYINTDTSKRAQFCVKWSPDGSKLALSLLHGKIGIWDLETKKIIHENFCYFEVMAIEWVTNDRLVIGCTDGSLTMATGCLETKKRVIHAHNSSIILIKSSVKNKYLATSGLDRTVCIWDLEGLEFRFSVQEKEIVRGLAWHPWKDSLLAFGTDLVSLWNVNTKKHVAHEKCFYEFGSIDCLSFNPISAELVVGYYVKENADVFAHGTNLIAVLANMDTIVEELYYQKGRILQLLWSNSGEFMGSISTDETMCILEFFGSSSEKQKSKKLTRRMTSKNCNKGKFTSCIR